MKKIRTHPFFLIIVLLNLLASSLLSAEEVTVQDLASQWDFYGEGSRKVEGRLFYMKEDPGSKGVMIVSPESYGENIRVSYEIMPMNAASVLVFALNASDAGDGKSLTLPEGYDGSMGYWVHKVNLYFFAFHNAAHDRTPFVKIFPGGETLAEAEANVMRVGFFHTVVVEREGAIVRLSVDGNLLFEGRDENPIGGGHLAFRIRGISEETASCLIRNVRIEQL